MIDYCLFSCFCSHCEVVLSPKQSRNKNVVSVSFPDCFVPSLRSGQAINDLHPINNAPSLNDKSNSL